MITLWNSVKSIEIQLFAGFMFPASSIWRWLPGLLVCFVPFVPFGRFLWQNCSCPTVSSCLSYLSAKCSKAPTVDSCWTDALTVIERRAGKALVLASYLPLPCPNQRNHERDPVDTRCLQKLLGNGSSRPRTITIVSCPLAPSKLIITGQGSNLLVFGSDSKKDSQQGTH